MSNGERTHAVQIDRDPGVLSGNRNEPVPWRNVRVGASYRGVVKSFLGVHVTVNAALQCW